MNRSHPLRWTLSAALLSASLTLACGEEEQPPAGDAGVLEDASSSTPDASTSLPDAAAPDADAIPRNGIGVLGYESHSIDQVELLEIGREGLRVPRALAFNPQGDGELWVVNRADDSTVTYFKVGTAEQTQVKIIDPFAEHFMEEPSSIAFGAPGTFATCQESRNTYNNRVAPNDFMGPALWSSDMDVYGKSNPEAVDFLGFDLGSHLDMLHESPNCMGIAWEKDNVYWTFDGMSGSISRYDFQADHGVGFDDHSDGIIARYVAGQVSRVENVPSHMQLDHETGLLYVADTGNARIAVLDTASGLRGNNLPSKEPGVQHYSMDSAIFNTLVDSAGGELIHPSGLAILGELVFVTDNANGRISAFDKETGARVDWLDTGFPERSLMGLTFDAQGRMYLVDAVTPRVVRISSKP